MKHERDSSERIFLLRDLTAALAGTYDDHVQLGYAVLVDGHRHWYTILFDKHFSIRQIT